MKKIIALWLALLFCLSACGTPASSGTAQPTVNGQSPEPGAESSPPPSAGESATPAGLETAPIDSTATLQSNVGGNQFNQVMETDKGYYFNPTAVYESPEGEVVWNDYGGGGMQLHYYDKKTGEFIYLCPKPECAHDGSTFCTATSKALRPHHTALYGDALYIAATNPDNDVYSLYKASLNGTELSKLVDFMKLSNGFTFVVNMQRTFAIHQNKVFVVYSSSMADQYLPCMSGLMMIDLDSLKCTLIEEAESGDSFAYLSHITASGDYVLYWKNVNGKETQSALMCYNLADGSLRKLTRTFEDAEGVYPLHTQSFTVIGDELWYASSTRYLTGILGQVIASEIRIQNLQTGEERVFKGDLAAPDEGKFPDEPEDIRYGMRAFRDSRILYDGQVLYITDRCGFYGTSGGLLASGSTANLSSAYIYSLEGECLGRFDYKDHEGAYQVNVLNGKVYIQTTSELVSCKVEDIIAGKVEWTTEVRYDGGKVN